jgi:hypothetical protein
MVRVRLKHALDILARARRSPSARPSTTSSPRQPCGVEVLRIAEIGATPDPVVILEDGRLEGQLEGHVISVAEAGLCRLRDVKRGVLLDDARSGFRLTFQHHDRTAHRPVALV